MRLLQFVPAGGRGSPRVGVQPANDAEASVIDLTAATADTSFPISRMQDYLRLTCGDTFIEEHRDARAAVDAAVAAGDGLPLDKIRVRAPVYGPDKVICVGMNYTDHCLEQGVPVPTEPVLFNKFPSSVSAPGDPIPLAPEVAKLDFEVELVIVIGRTGRRIPKDKAMEYVAGYTVCHDVSARDWQLERNGGQWMMGKAQDGYLPLGPAIVTTDAIGDPHKLALGCRVNGEVMQSSNTEQLVFKTEEVVEWCSRFFTLRPGDLIATGTPPGVGCFRKPPVWLKAGDEVTVYVEGIGAVSNVVEAERLPGQPAAVAAGGGAATGGSAE